MAHQTENSLELISPMEKIAGTDITNVTITQQNASHHIIPGNYSPERSCEYDQEIQSDNHCENCSS